MLRKKKEQKKDKPRKSSSFFSNLNADSNIEYGFAEKNPKSKWAKWIILGLVGASAATGVIVPWTVSSCTIQNTKPFDPNEVMYYYFDPITKKNVLVTYEEFSKRVEHIKATSTIVDKWDDVLYKSVLESLYKEEREAFLKFKAIYKKLHNENPNISNFGLDLSSSLNDIESNQKKILENNKKTFQKAVGNSNENWLDLWIKELQTNSIYGPQQTESGTGSLEFLESKALSYMVFTQINSSALARYQGTIISSNSWTYTDYQFANTLNPLNEEYTKYTDGENKEKVITKNEAVEIWKSYLSKGINVVQPKNPNSSDDSNKKIAVFETKSYLPEFRNPIKTSNLLDIINSNYAFSLVSSFSISDIKPGEKQSSPFSFTTDVLTKLFKIQNTNGISATQNFIPISRLSYFKGASVINTTETNTNDIAYISNAKDSLLVKTFDSSDSSSTANNFNLGSSKLLENSSHLSTSSNNQSNSDSSSSDSNSSSINSFSLFALSSSLEGAKNNLGNESTLFSINKINPFKEFMTLIFSIANSSSNEINFGSNLQAEKNWNLLNYGSKIASPNLKAFINHLNSYLDPTTYEFNNKINAIDYNTILSNLLTDHLTSTDLTFLGQILNCILIGDASTISVDYRNNKEYINKVGYWSLYQLDSETSSSTGTYLYIDVDGLKVFTRSKSQSLTLLDYQKMVINDLNQTINSSNDSVTLNYDISTVFSKLNDSNLILNILLSDQGNQTKFKEAIQNYIDNYKASGIKSTADEIFKDFYENVNLNFSSTINDANNKIIQNISTIFSNLIDSKRIYDFATITNSFGEEVAIFQTQNLYGLSAIAQGYNNIISLATQTMLNILEVKKSNLNLNKGGK